MLTDESLTQLTAFKIRKTAQGAAAMAYAAGVSMVVSGEQGSQIVISIANDQIAEAVIIGQLPHIHLKSTGSPKNPVRRDAPNDQKPVEKRAIDLTDDQVRAVLDTWAAGRSALEHDFIVAIYDSHGRLKVR